MTGTNTRSESKQGGRARARLVLGVIAAAAVMSAVFAPVALAGTFRADSAVGGAISDFATTTVPLVLSGVNRPVSSVKLSLFIRHTCDSDLGITLVGPDGRSVLLANKVGGTWDNFGVAAGPDASRTTFDDTAASSITTGLAPFVGIYRPDQPLSAFVGMSGAQVNGTWNLVVHDFNEGDTGDVVVSSVIVETTEPVVAATKINLTGKSSVVRKHAYKLAGTVTPAAAGGKAKIVYKRYSKKKWRQVGSAKYATISGGRFSLSYKPATRGSWRAFVTYPGQTTYNNIYTASPSVYKQFKVK